MTALIAELWFLSRDRSAVLWLSLAAVAATVAVAGGTVEVQAQRAAIEQLKRADAEQRQLEIESQKDWGSSAYYIFHLTYDEPSDLAFAALGQRDAAPWKHRIRMLALEGQIYETDAHNPAFAAVGRFDFAFFASMITPLLVAFLLHGLRASERHAGRFELLEATARNGGPWLTRAGLRVFALMLCVLGPSVAVGLWQGSTLASLGALCIAVALHIIFWSAVCEIVGRRVQSSAASLTVLIGLWLVLAVLAPAGIKNVVERLIHVPEGGDILLAQREAVNDAWDLPKSATMDPFVERHPQWQAFSQISRPFEWKWYFAFQQVGDQTVESQSQAYRAGRRRRDELTGWLTLLSPPAWLERTLQHFAHTDVAATLAYERDVRDFHGRLRAFYYPLLFKEQPFERAQLETLPSFAPKAQLRAPASPSVADESASR